MSTDAPATADSETVNAMSNNKMLHVVFRVGDMDRTIKFYKDVFGMQLLRYRDIPEEKYSNAFLGYGTESRGEHFSLELTYNYGVESYDVGDALDCYGLQLPNLREVAKKATALGGEVIFGPEDIEVGPSLVPDEEVGKKTVDTVLRLKDPDGWGFEVLQARNRRDPVSKVSVKTLNMEDSIEFYEKALGMKLLRRRSLLPRTPTQVAWVGYGTESDSTVVEIVYEYGTETLDQGNGYGQVAISTPDVYKAAEHIKAAGYEVTRDPGPVPGIGTKITAVRDPDGFKIVLVDEEDIEKELVDA
ncbi:unnamed protein product [Discosporangium mesarthrocarpum]